MGLLYTTLQWRSKTTTGFYVCLRLLSPEYDTNLPLPKRYTGDSMRRIASFVAILVLLSAAAPLLACMTDSAMSQEESACCRSMHGNCGDMTTMGCCRTEVRTDHHPQMPSIAPSIDVQFVVISWLPPVVAEAQNVPASLLRRPDEHSPPGLLTARITVLRI